MKQVREMVLSKPVGHLGMSFSQRLELNHTSVK